MLNVVGASLARRRVTVVSGEEKVVLIAPVAMVNPEGVKETALSPGSYPGTVAVSCAVPESVSAWT
jgi:hypothetical protein